MKAVVTIIICVRETINNDIFNIQILYYSTAMRCLEADLTRSVDLGDNFIYGLPEKLVNFVQKLQIDRTTYIYINTYGHIIVLFTYILRLLILYA